MKRGDEFAASRRYVDRITELLRDFVRSATGTEKREDHCRDLGNGNRQSTLEDLRNIVERAYRAGARGE